jgi:hypothetical protein
MTPPIPLDCLPKHPSILIRISHEWRPGLSDAQRYERVRQYWRARPDKRSAPPVLAEEPPGKRDTHAFCVM